jgi:hypothetical protein
MQAEYAGATGAGRLALAADRAVVAYAGWVNRTRALALIPHEPNFVQEMAIRSSSRAGEPDWVIPGNFLELRGTAHIPRDWPYLTKRIYAMLPATVMLDVLDHAVMLAVCEAASVTGDYGFIAWRTACTPVITSIRSRQKSICPRAEYLAEPVRFEFRAEFRRLQGNVWGRVSQARLFNPSKVFADFRGSRFTFVETPRASAVA